MRAQFIVADSWVDEYLHILVTKWAMQTHKGPQLAHILKYIKLEICKPEGYKMQKVPEVKDRRRRKTINIGRERASFAIVDSLKKMKGFAEIERWRGLGIYRVEQWCMTCPKSLLMVCLLVENLRDWLEKAKIIIKKGREVQQLVNSKRRYNNGKLHGRLKVEG